MTDLPAQLRKRADDLMHEPRFESGGTWTHELLRRAADEIERLDDLVFRHHRAGVMAVPFTACAVCTQTKGGPDAQHQEEAPGQTGTVGTE
jgi:hypothetical protein